MERRLAGRWFTPAPVARLALSIALGDEPGGVERLVDPTCGDGVFLEQARRSGVPADRLWGLEIEGASAARAATRAPGAHISVGDLFSPWAPSGPGFDLVVGNPPYVRGERLEVAKKRRIAGCLGPFFEEDGAELREVLARGDLAAACLLRGLSWLRPGGRLAFVVSTALFDADYADALWTLIGRYAAFRAIVCAPTERWFEDAAVHTVIVCLERCRSPGARPPVPVYRLREATDRAARRVTCLKDLSSVAELRSVKGTPRSWSMALRTPPVWQAYLDNTGSALVPVSDLATVRRGATTGANSVFYLSRAEASRWSIEAELLRPLVRSPREAGASRLRVDPAETPQVVLQVPSREDSWARYPAAARYLRHHEQLAARPTLRARRPWWAVPEVVGQVFFTKAYHDRYAQRWADEPLWVDQRYYALTPRSPLDVLLLAAILNSSWAAFAIECTGRASMGEGALELTVDDLRRLPVPDPRKLSEAACARARAALVALSRRPIGCAGDEGNDPDRGAMDQALMPRGSPPRAEIVEAWVAMGSQRLQRTGRRRRGTGSS